MAYHVRLLERAQRDLIKIESGSGPAWFEDLIEAIYSLATFPDRCTFVSRLSTDKRSVWQLIYGRDRNVYRIYFTIVGTQVIVIHVRHGYRKPLRRL